MGNRKDQSSRLTRRASVRRRLLVEHLGDRRVLATISGAVFDDANFSFNKDAEETNLPARLVYLDANDNATLDVGERFVVGESDGTFTFENVADGTHLLRLFNGTQTQQQTTPVEATLAGQPVLVDASQFLLGDDAVITLNDSSISLGDLETGGNTGIPVGNVSDLTKMQSLPDGKILVIGSDENGDTAWVVDPTTGESTPVELDPEGQPIDVAVDGDGRGVLVAQTGNDTALIRGFHAADSSVIQVSAASIPVAAQTQVLTSANATRTVVASREGNGLQLSLWSNSQQNLITVNPDDPSDPFIGVEGTFEALAYDDASGLLALRTLDGGVSVHDVNRDFAILHTLPDVTGPVAIDGVRDLLLTVSPIDAMLRIFNMQDGALIANLAIDVSVVGQVASLAVGDRPDAIVVLGAAGVTEVALNKPAAKRVTVEGGQDVDAVLFGVALSDENIPPTYNTVPSFTTPEDIGFARPAPAALEGSIDVDTDQFVLIQNGPAAHGPAAHGQASISIDGAISYTPDRDYFGTDTVSVLLHDGRDVSSIFDIRITVTPTPDPPTDIDIDADPVPEHIQPGQPVADIEIIDLDLNDNHIIVIEDGRFGLRNGQIIFLQGQLDFENEPVISILINVTDPETNTEIERLLTLQVADENDPITAITPHVGSVSENVLGDFAVKLLVEDQDVGQTHTLSVDDDRFVIVNSELRLAEDVAVNFEEDPEIKVNVTADDGNGSTFTQEVTVQVIDIDEQPESITLSNESVMELEPGEVVGEITVDGAAPNERLTLTVDDPRFEIDGSTLQLMEDQFVERASQEEIQLTITVSDSRGELDAINETFVIRVDENLTPFHNDDNPYDVDHSLDVTSLDALLVINYLNLHGPGPVGDGDPGFGYDVNGDGFVTALDALLILNEINRQRISGTVGSRVAEGEQTDNGTRNLNAPANDESAETDDNVREDVFNNWESDRLSARTAGKLPTSDPVRSPIDDGSETSESEEFAEGVDETLRLLSGETE